MTTVTRAEARQINRFFDTAKRREQFMSCIPQSSYRAIWQGKWSTEYADFLGIDAPSVLFLETVGETTRYYWEWYKTPFAVAEKKGA